MIKCCVTDQFPLVQTFEMPGAELHCLKCGGYFGIFNCVSREPTDEDVSFHQFLVEAFEKGHRGPVEGIENWVAPPIIKSDDNIKCDGCGKDSGRTKEQGKPASWYQRTIKGVTDTACSRDCIEIVSKTKGGSSLVLPI